MKKHPYLSFLFLVFLFGGSVLAEQPKSVLDTTSETECDRLSRKGRSLKSEGAYKAEYDTLKFYIEHCATLHDAFHEFGALNGAIQYLSDDNNRWLGYVEWLKKVLYLNPDNLYYCADATSMLNSFNYIRPGQGQDWNGMIAVIDFILATNRCQGDSISLVYDRNYIRNAQIRSWRDTSADTLKTPIDTTLPNIDDLGLKILRGPQFAANQTPTTGKSGIGFVRAERNPFSNETAIVYELGESALVRLEVYDALGRQVFSEGGGVAQAGEHRWQLDTKLWSSGIYYGRLSTLGGEVRTVKLVKE